MSWVEKIFRRSKKPPWAKGRKTTHKRGVDARRGRPASWRLSEAEWISVQRKMEQDREGGES